MPTETFSGLPYRPIEALRGVRAALLGVAEASPYTPGEASHSDGAPAALRRASALYGTQIGQHDFDLDAPFLQQDREKHVPRSDLGGIGALLAARLLCSGMSRIR
jgi:hypothetical protein